MNARERFRRIMRFEPADGVPLWDVEGITETAVRQWIVNGDVPIGMSRKDLVSYDPRVEVKLDVDPIPAFVCREIASDEEWRTTTDQYGFTVKMSKTQSIGPTIYIYLDGPVHSRADWEDVKKRYDPDDPRRTPRDWSPELLESYETSSGPVGLRVDWGPGRHVKNGYMMGMERFLETVVTDPGLLRDMFEFWADFVIALARPWVDKVTFDFAYVGEDGLAYKNSSLVSPEMYRRIWAPAARRVTDFLHQSGIGVIGYYTSGNVTPLIPELLDTGFNLIQPLECAAGMDAPALRREFRKDLLMIGNISRQAFMAGPEAVEREFSEKVPALMAEGGFIPAIDDMVMPDMPYASVRRYGELVRDFRP